MAQNDLIISNQSFPSFRQDLNLALQAINSNHSGSTTPSGAVAGTIWLDTTNATIPLLKYYDGVDNITLATINHSTNTVDFNDSTISTPLAVTGNATAGAEIRLPEDTDNGTNFVALKAPDSIASNLTLTLPSADGTAGQVLQTNGSGVLSFATVGGLAWQSVQTSSFTAVASRGYPCNTTSGSITVTLPASPSGGDTIKFVDYAGTAPVNFIILNPNGNKIDGSTSNKSLVAKNQGVEIVYIDSTQGWKAVSSANENFSYKSLATASYAMSYLVIGGGGGTNDTNSTDDLNFGGGGAGGYRNSFSTETSGGGNTTEEKLPVSVGTVYSIQVGSGGGITGTAGGASKITSTVDNITSEGGGGASKGSLFGGSGAGGFSHGELGTFSNGGSGTVNQGFNGGNGFYTSPTSASGGGGGSASANGSNAATAGVGGAGANGLASLITGSSVTRAAGGGGGGTNTRGNGGTGGGGNGGKRAATTTLATDGTANTGSGGGGESHRQNGRSGGSGVVILHMPTANYSGTTTGSPTVSTSGSDTILVYNATGTYTG